MAKGAQISKCYLSQKHSVGRYFGKDGFELLQQKMVATFKGPHLNKNLSFPQWAHKIHTGIIILPTQTMQYCKENSSRLPHICIKFDSPKKWVPSNDPCQRKEGILWLVEGNDFP